VGLLDFWRAKAPAKTPGVDTSSTLGAAMPGAHTAAATPAVVEVFGDELPNTSHYAPRAARSYRGRQSFAPPQGPATAESHGSLPSAHVGYGSPDPRGVWGGTAGHTGPTDERLRPAEEVNLQQQAVPVVAHAEGPPMEFRAGGGGKDNTRSSRFALALFARPFDQWASYGPSATPKIPSASPLASRPLSYAESVRGALPAPGGGGPTGMEAVGGQPNSVRLLPRAWDVALVNNGTAAPVADRNGGQVTSQRAAGWRGRG